MSSNQLLDDRHLLLRSRRQPVAILLFGSCVGQPVGVRQTDPHLSAVRWGDVALGLDLAPWGVVAFWADETEDLVSVAVLANERRSEPSRRRACKSAVNRNTGVNGGAPVINDQSPVTGIKQVKVRIRPCAERSTLGRSQS